MVTYASNYAECASPSIRYDTNITNLICVQEDVFILTLKKKKVALIELNLTVLTATECHFRVLPST